jgi:ectoine hydroxylase-related dioxygenase (phytanoyl-CoA dioxygenase family)
MSIAEMYLGADAFPYRATLFEKSLRSNWLVSWHQDTALPLRERRETTGWGPWSIKYGVPHAIAPAEALNSIVALRLHLDDSTSENGPLRVLPGTHSFGVVDHKRVDELRRIGKPVECLTHAGGVVAMRPLLLHSSSKARNNQPRRVLHVEYAATLTLENGLELAVG